MWWIATYHWLENNNLWKACVAWSVGLALNAIWAVRLWIQKAREDRARHDAIMDKLDTETPGGLGELKRVLRNSRDYEAPDDNGTDVPDTDDNRPRRRGHGSGHYVHEHDQGHTDTPVHSSFLDSIHVDKGGGGGAAHR